MTNRLVFGAWLVVVVLSMGCQGPVEFGGPPPGSQTVVGKHEFLRADEPTKTIGQSCDIGGASECVSDLCIHASPEGRLHTGYRCSQLCGPGRDACPQGFTCVQGHPSADGMWCLEEKPKARPVAR